ncbi:MAG: response regulator transcription factor [Candidatus Didemnitutus sp.]|nr:response regulator transcription factor [Candidatus Didemnitutus sp.]
MSNRTALLIDDEAYFRHFVGEILRRNLITTVIEARDGEEAITLFEQHKPDFVLLDINMPRKDGIETLIELRNISAEVPIVMLTSVADEVIVEQCVEHGASYFLRKDIPAHEMLSELKSVLADLFVNPEPPSE